MYLFAEVIFYSDQRKSLPANGYHPDATFNKDMMTAKEVFYDLNQKYGEEFNWRMIPLTDKRFIEELKKELGQVD